MSYPVKAGKTVNDEKVEATVYYDFGADISEMIDKYGEDQVFALALSEGKRKLKAAIRRELDNGTAPDDVPDRLSTWRPDVKHQVAQDPEDAAVAAFNAMSEEAQEKYLAKMREKIAKGKG